MNVSVAWSGGKDAAYALAKILKDSDYYVHSLHTSFDAKLKRVGLHGIHEDLIQAQADAIGLPLDKLYLPASDNHQAYEQMMTNYLLKLKQAGVEAVVFGDIFLQDLKQYREAMLRKVGLRGVFPLWGSDTLELAQELMTVGIRTIICAADDTLIDKQWVGKHFDNEFISHLPDSADACGENGEFHSYVIHAPYFSREIGVHQTATQSHTYHYDVRTAQGGVKTMEKKFNFAELLLDDSQCFN